MNDEEYLDAFSDLAFAELDDADGDITKLDDPLHTAAIIFAAQGVIDNGGLRYFFESNWPYHPPYSVFADAYERIGRLAAASAIREAAATFGVDDPEHHCDLRCDYIDEHYDSDTYEVIGWNDCICGDEEVWTDLTAWLKSQKNVAEQVAASDR